MNFLIDIGHPAHVHLFKNFAWEMQAQGHGILFTCREKEFEIALLQKYGFQYKSLGKKYSSKAGKLWGIVKFSLRELITCLKYKPDVLISHGSMYAAYASFFTGKPHLALEDTGNWEQVRLYLPFTRCVLTSDIFPYNYGSKQIRYPSHHELAYLFPGRFIPDKDFFSSTGINPQVPYVVLRFVAWNASHDIGAKGLALDTKLKIIEKLEKKYRVMISSEAPLPESLSKYRVTFKPWQMHDALYNASLFIGEGTTMAMEAALLGTPSVYVNSLQYANIDDLAKHGLIYNLSDDTDILNLLDELMAVTANKSSLKEKLNSLLSLKIDLTAFLIWFVINWPDSKMIVKNDHKIMERFRLAGISAE